MSGAGRSKGDASDEDTLYEFKDANKTFQLKAVDLDKIFRYAVRQGKVPVFNIEFANGLVLEGVVYRGNPHKALKDGPGEA